MKKNIPKDIGKGIKAKQEITETPIPSNPLKLNPVWSFKRMKAESTKKCEWVICHSHLGKLDKREPLFEKGKLFEVLSGLEGLTWENVLHATHDASKSSHHHIDISTDAEIVKFDDKARKKLRELRSEGYPAVFSMRINNLHRLYGVTRYPVFEIIWSDMEHIIYPSDD